MSANAALLNVVSAAKLVPAEERERGARMVERNKAIPEVTRKLVTLALRHPDRVEAVLMEEIQREAATA